VHDRTEPLPSHAGSPMLGRVEVEPTLIEVPVGIEPGLEWRQAVVRDEREVQLDELLEDQGVDMSALVDETERNTDGTVHYLQGPLPDEVELDEAEVEW
ncbi:MAG: hypothetical protein ACREQ5_17415, partial [Candidatus Dormibacteria bacterium]